MSVLEDVLQKAQDLVNHLEDAVKAEQSEPEVSDAQVTPVSETPTTPQPDAPVTPQA